MMLLDLEKNILADYHVKLEGVNELTPLLQPDHFNWDRASEELRVLISAEVNALSVINKSHIVNVFRGREETVTAYFNSRIEATGNDLLKAKYYHVLYCFSGHNKDIHKALDHYKRMLERWLEDPLEQGNYVRYGEVLDVVLLLTKMTKYQLCEVKLWLGNNLNDTEVPDRLKTWIMSSMVGSKLFKVDELALLPGLTCAIAERETAHRFVEINLLLGLEIANKLQDEPLIKQISERLGDNDLKMIKVYDGRPESMMVPHQNNHVYLKIIKWYKRSGNQQKTEDTIAAYNLNKKDTRFISIKAPKSAQTDIHRVGQLIDRIAGQHAMLIINHLIFGEILPLHSEDALNQFVSRHEDSVMHKLMKPMVQDLNNNGKEVSVTENLRFQAYDSSMPFTISFVMGIILNAMDNGMLSYGKASKTLGSTMYFGQVLTLTRDGREYEYSWLEMIELGLKSFFDQCRKLLKEAQPDWRLTVDILSLKFEGILRDMAALSGGVTTKVDANGNSSELLLEDLLRLEAIRKVFNQNDINLFLFTLTSKGYNIRNDVAHSFYKKQDYSVKKAVLSLLCILRLAKFRYVVTKKNL